jgi:hypothetical protein
MALFVATPIMTSNSTPSGVVSGSYLTSGVFPFWQSLDQDSSSDARVGLNSGTVVDKWLKYDFGSTQSIDAFRVQSSNYFDTGSIKTFKLQGSTNDSTWDDLHSVTDATYTSDNEWTPTYNLSSTASYRYYRLYITDNYDGWLGANVVEIAELELLVELPAVDVPATTLTLTTPTPQIVEGKYASIPSTVLTLVSAAPSLKIGPISLTAPSVTLTMTTYPPALQFTVDPNIPSYVVYRCTLTGAADATNDVVLPISSFQSRMRDATPSYLSVVVPDATTYADSINARPNGQIKLERGVTNADGTTWATISQVDLETVADDGGGRSRTITISGHQTQTTSSPKSVTLSGVSYRGVSNSGTRYRAELDLNLRPGDTAVTDYGSITAELITYIVDTTQELMEVSDSV